MFELAYPLFMLGLFLGYLAFTGWLIEYLQNKHKELKYDK